jgi:DNA-directed RNA polymerase subunit RPC12/RpoP
MKTEKETTTRTCVDCDGKYVATAKHVGRINQCSKCGSKIEVDTVCAVPAYEDKNTSTLTFFKNQAEFDTFKKLSRVGSVRS